MSLGVCEALWLRLLLRDLGCSPRQPIHIYCDNKAACDIAHNPVQHDRTKHVEVDRFFIKEKLDEKIVKLPTDQRISWPIFSQKLFQVECSQSFWASWACVTSMHQLEGEC